MKALTVSAVLCLTIAYMTTAGVMAAEETPEEAQNYVAVSEDVQGSEAVAQSELAEVPENDNEIDAAVRMYCPPGWFNLGDRCYLYVSSQMTWINAEKHCVNQQGALASVRSASEYNFLQSLVQVAGKTSAWLGGFHFQGEWMWIDRTGFFYTNWDSPASTTHYQCIFMRSAGGWSNTNCASKVPFFCSRSLNSC